MNQIIEDIKTACSDLFPNKLFFLSLSDQTFVISGNNSSTALNNHNGNLYEINVQNWFENFWLYLEINFVQYPVESKFSRGGNKKEYFELLNNNFLKIKDEYYNLFISLSIFQGGYNKEEKKQLFRAEWDNYENNEFHPQPHWHFYPKENKTIDFKAEDSTDFIVDDTKKEIDLKRIHFAMNGEWAQNGEHIHKINSSKALVNWLSGALKHIKEQLEKTKTIKH